MEQVDMPKVSSNSPICQNVHHGWHWWVPLFLQLIIAIYGGYFGGGIGILMLATLGLMGMENIHEMNAMKTLLTTCINGVALVVFVRAVVYFSKRSLMGAHIRFLRGPRPQ